MILFFIVVFLVNVIEAIAGFGSISIGVPILSIFMGAEDSIAILTVTSLLMLAIMFVTQFKRIHWKEFLIVLACIAPFMPIGYLLFAKLRYVEWALRLIIGVLVTLVSGREILRMVRKKEAKPLSKSGTYVALGVGSVIQGMLTMGAPLINIYALNRLKDKSTFRATMVAVWLSTNIITTVYRAMVMDIYTKPIMLNIAYALPLVIVAYLVGNKLHHKISNEKFSNFVYIIQFVAGLISIAGGVAALI